MEYVDPKTKRSWECWHFLFSYSISSSLPLIFFKKEFWPVIICLEVSPSLLSTLVCFDLEFLSSLFFFLLSLYHLLL